MKWQPISTQNLNRIIEQSERQLTKNQKIIWQKCKIAPEKWFQESWGKKDG
jgi:hypothetical protein